MKKKDRIPLVEVQGLKTCFYKGKGILSKAFGKGLRIVYAVDDVSFTIEEGETFGLVGESGCGKTTVGRSILRLVEPTAGQIFFEGQNLLELSKEGMRKFRRKAQIIIQDPRSSLNPRMTAGEIIAEPFRIHGLKRYEDEIEDEVARLLETVGLSSEDADKYPHEFSGGQARRIGVARALALHPQFIVADEPTSGLDVSITAAILDLIQDLQDEFKLTYLWISHNLHVVKYISDRIAILYLGKIVEMGRTEDILDDPIHPYTQALFSAIPTVNPGQKTEKIILKGEVPSPIHPPSGCRFRTRCWRAMGKCSQEEPELMDVGEGHYAACHLVG
ncbi:ATP-binding cassette domain-containing protein [Candidatus Bipolaricaulota bacterium]|nr:ATP-binding cassette domain-containing protein [Candidatus Bipolaricaulota bacterium]